MSGTERTGVEGVGHFVEHVRVHVGVDGPVGGGVIARGDEHGVALGDGEREQGDGAFFNVCAVNLSTVVD